MAGGVNSVGSTRQSSQQNVGWRILNDLSGKLQSYRIFLFFLFFSHFHNLPQNWEFSNPELILQSSWQMSNQWDWNYTVLAKVMATFYQILFLVCCLVSRTFVKWKWIFKCKYVLCAQSEKEKSTFPKQKDGSRSPCNRMTVSMGSLLSVSATLDWLDFWWFFCCTSWPDDFFKSIINEHSAAATSEFS